MDEKYVRIPLTLKLIDVIFEKMTAISIRIVRKKWHLALHFYSNRLR